MLLRLSSPSKCTASVDNPRACAHNRGDSKHDTNIFCLAVLLSSTLVYNSRGTIDNRAVEELQTLPKETYHLLYTFYSGLPH
ncbi:hypothetical protein QQF64_034478 [Cirrhinus molitorella]|uniref:Guanylate-binding protein N-terminal domain-containing protein n=1 Tax=Cirrhinus molitorella TaxID=172907 RepID=A0ABR3L2G9_9TELE